MGQELICDGCGKQIEGDVFGVCCGISPDRLKDLLNSHLECLAENENLRKEVERLNIVVTKARGIASAYQMQFSTEQPCVELMEALAELDGKKVKGASDV